MILPWLTLAWALDFVPQYDGDTKEAEDPPSLDPDRSTERQPASVDPQLRQVASFATLREPDHVWLDEVNLEVAVSGDHGRRYYLIATVFVGPEQRHWQQGPYDAPDSTLPVTIELPADVVAAVLEEGRGQLSLQVSSTDFAERSIRFHEPPDTVYLFPMGDSIVGMERSAATYPLTAEDP